MARIVGHLSHLYNESRKEVKILEDGCRQLGRAKSVHYFAEMNKV